MRTPTPATILAGTALFVSLGGVGLAANGDNLLLGKINTAASATFLSAPVVGGKSFVIKNGDATNPSSTALSLNVASGHAPLTVNSRGLVANLNAGLLDGRTPGQIFWVAGGHTGLNKLPNATGTWTTVAKTSFTTSTTSSWVMQGQDNVGFNNGSQPASANLRFLVNGAVDDSVFPSTIDPNSVQGIAAVINCNGMPADTYTVELQVETYAGSGSFTSNVGSLAVLGN